MTIFTNRCHKSVKGSGRWIKRELLEMQEGRSKEQAKYLLQVYLIIYTNRKGVDVVLVVLELVLYVEW